MQPEGLRIAAASCAACATCHVFTQRMTKSAGSPFSLSAAHVGCTFTSDGFNTTSETTPSSPSPVGVFRTVYSIPCERARSNAVPRATNVTLARPGSCRVLWAIEAYNHDPTPASMQQTIQSRLTQACCLHTCMRAPCCEIGTDFASCRLEAPARGSRGVQGHGYAAPPAPTITICGVSSVLADMCAPAKENEGKQKVDDGRWARRVAQRVKL